jgi:hypothetical protein
LAKILTQEELLGFEFEVSKTAFEGACFTLRCACDCFDEKEAYSGTDFFEHVLTNRLFNPPLVLQVLRLGCFGTEFLRSLEHRLLGVLYIECPSSFCSSRLISVSHFSLKLSASRLFTKVECSSIEGCSANGEVVTFLPAWQGCYNFFDLKSLLIFIERNGCQVLSRYRSL